MKKILTIISIIVCLSIGLYASNAGDWLEIAPNARALGMGGAQIAGTNSAYAPFWNPASRSHMTEIGSTFASMPGEVSYQYFGAMHSFAFGRIGLGYLRVGLDGLQSTDLSADLRPIVNGSDFSVANSAILVSYSGSLSSVLEVGATAKIINNSIASATASGFALDLGVQYLVLKNVQLGAVVYNALSPVISWSTGAEEAYPMKVKVGIHSLLSDDLVFSFDADIIGYQNTGIHAGAEYWLNQLCALRAGYDKNALSIGVGIVYQGFRFDYAYTMASTDYLDATSRFSLGYVFAKPHIIVPASGSM